MIGLILPVTSGERVDLPQKQAMPQTESSAPNHLDWAKINFPEFGLWVENGALAGPRNGA